MHFHRSEWPSLRTHFHDVSQIPNPEAGGRTHLPIFVDRDGPPQPTFSLAVLIFLHFAFLIESFVCLFGCHHLSIVLGLTGYVGINGVCWD